MVRGGLAREHNLREAAMARRTYELCPPEMRGREWTEEQRDKVWAVVRDYLVACDGQLDEALAMNLLHDLLAVEIPEALKWEWGRLVRRWLRRWGLREKNTGVATRMVTSLHNEMLLEGCMGAAPENISYGLGASRRITPSFWVGEMGRTRLTVTLQFVRLTAGQALVELLDGWELLAPVQAVEYTPPAEAAVVALVDSFWEAKVTRVGNQVGPHRENLQHFGAWVKTRYLTAWGSKKKLALKVATVMGWNTQTNDSGVAGCEMLISHLLAGRCGGWNLRSLPVLAKFVEVPLGQLVRDYVAYRDGSAA